LVFMAPSKNLDYRFYITNGLMLKGGGKYNAMEPLKTVRQRGARAVAERIGFTGRVDYTLPYNLRVGFSFWMRRSTKLGSMTMISPHL
jgi:hypothetical protein